MIPNASRDFKTVPASDAQNLDNNFPTVDWQDLADKRNQQTNCFVQEAVYPKESIIETFIENCRPRVECPDIYLLGAILPVMAALLARRVYTPWVPKKLYPNLFSLLIGMTGMQKTPPVLLAKEVATPLLHNNSFLSHTLSAEVSLNSITHPKADARTNCWSCRKLIS